jgi:hypothetical protein
LATSRNKVAAPIFLLASFQLYSQTVTLNYSENLIGILSISFLFSVLFVFFSRVDESTGRANITDDSQSYQQYLTLEIVSSQLRAAVSVDGATVRYY